MTGGLDTVYTLGASADAETFYNGWADGYDAELAENGYVTPRRCAEALAAHAMEPTAPLIEFGCGTGLGGVALQAAGFNTLDGFDISQEMLERARQKALYRSLGVMDLAKPLEIETGVYQNAAAIGVLNPAFMPPTVLDEMLAALPTEGCLVVSINDNSARDGSMETRILELTEYNIADLVFKDYGEHLPGVDLQSTVYVLKKR
ncbi:MAG: methyltransferase domain-containing protein [Pseudomonadota bacterium]